MRCKIHDNVNPYANKCQLSAIFHPDLYFLSGDLISDCWRVKLCSSFIERGSWLNGVNYGWCLRLFTSYFLCVCNKNPGGDVPQRNVLLKLVQIIEIRIKKPIANWVLLIEDYLSSEDGFSALANSEDFGTLSFLSSPILPSCIYEIIYSQERCTKLMFWTSRANFQAGIRF